MRLSSAKAIIGLCLICGAARAAEVRLSLVSRSRTGGEMMLRAEVVPDVPDLGAGDFEITIRPATAKDDAGAKTVRFIVKRLRGAYYFDVRSLPALPRGKYVLGMAVKKGALRVARALLRQELEYVPPQLDVALLIDQSFSMRRTDPERLRVAAAKTFVDLAASGNRIRNVCVVVFDAESRTLIPPTPPSQKDKFYTAIDRIGTVGQTNIDGALGRAHRELSQGGVAGKAAVLLTDGENQPKEYANAHRAFARSGWPIYTIGLSREADAATLQRIAKDTGGQYYPAPTNVKLREIFSRICFALEREVLLGRKAFTVNAGQTRRQSVAIDDTITRAIFSARSKQSEIGFSVIPPDKAARAEETSLKGPFKFYAYRLPKAGVWRPTVRGGAGAARVQLEATGATDLFPVLFPLAGEYGYGKPIEVACSLADGPRPISGAVVDATLRAADGKLLTARLASEGGGVYAGAFTGEIKDGGFDLVLSMRGRTARGNPFERQLDATGKIAPRRDPEIWAGATSVNLGRLYNGETGGATVELRKLLPPFTDLQLRAKCVPIGMPPGAFKVELDEPDAQGRQRLKLSATIPLAQRAAHYQARLLVTLGPKTTREIPVQVEVANPRLLIEPSSVDFGVLLGGASGKRRVRLRAAPRGSLHVALAVSGEVPAKLDRRSLRLSQKDQTVAVTATAPTDRDAPVRKHSGALNVVGDFERKTVPLSLTLMRTELIAEPAVLDFGEVEPGKSARRRLKLRVSGPVAVDAKAAAEFGGKLSPGAISLNGKTLRLSPAAPVEAEVSLVVPSSQRLGDVGGVLRFATDKQIGSVRLRVRIVPATTFVIEPDVADFGRVEIGRTSQTTVTIRSTTNVEQELRIAPAAGSGLITARPAAVKLGAGARAAVTLACLPPLDTQPARISRRFKVVGPMLPRSFTAQADVVPPPNGTFRLKDDYIPLGEAKPGGERSGAVTVVSTVEVPQKIALITDGSPEQSVWLTVAKSHATLEPRGTVDIPFHCSTSPGASSARHRLTIVVRGPLNERPATVSLGIYAPPATSPASSRHVVSLLLLLGMAITAALVFLVIRALLQIPSHRMIKYFAASGVLNLGFFLLLTQLLAVRKMMEEQYVMIRLDDTPDIVSLAARESSPSDKPMNVRENERRPESRKRDTPVTDPRKDSAKAEQERLEARRQEQERERARLESRIEKHKLDLSKLTAEQLEQVISSAEQVKRKIERTAKKQATPAAVDEPRIQAESDEQKKLEAAMELVRAAQELRAQRKETAAPHSRVRRPDSRTAKLTPQLVEAVLDEAARTRRKSEASVKPGTATARVGEGKPGLEGGDDRRGAAAPGKIEAGSARDATTRKARTPPAAAGPELRGRPPGSKLAANLDEHIAGEAQATRRKTTETGIFGATEAGVKTGRAGTRSSETKDARSGARDALPGVAAKEVASTRAQADSPRTAADIVRRTVTTRLSQAPKDTVAAETRDITQAEIVRGPTRRLGVSGDAGSTQIDGAHSPGSRTAVNAEAQTPLSAVHSSAPKLSARVGAELRTAGSSISRPEARAPEEILSEVSATAKKDEAIVGVSAPEAAITQNRSSGHLGGAEGPGFVPPAAPPSTTAREGDVERAKVVPGSSLVLGSPSGSPAKIEPASLGREALDPEARRIERRRSTTGAPRLAGTAVPVMRAAVGGKSSPGAIKAATGSIRVQAGEGDTVRISAQPARPAGISKVRAAVTRIAAAAPSEALVTAVGPVERRRVARPDASVGATLVGTPRAGVVDARDTKPGVIAAAPLRTEAQDGSAGRAAAGDPFGQSISKGTTSKPERVAPRAHETISVDVGPSIRRTETAAKVELPAQSRPTQRATGTGGADVKAPVTLSGPGSPVTSASNAPVTKDLDTRLDRGELLLAAVTGAPPRVPLSVPLDEPTSAVGAPVARRELERGPERGAAPVHTSQLEHRLRAAPRADVVSPELAPVSITPTRTARTEIRRGPIGDVNLPPTRTQITRPSGLDTVRKRAGGSVPFALARYSGDWDCDKTAMPNLAYQLERRVGILLSTEHRTIDITDPKLLRQPFVFISGHKDFRLTAAELAALRRYIRAGGSLWINDSTQELDPTFDRAVRREIKRLLPAGRIVKLPSDHNVFSSCYDLTRGFKGYKVPPGDKYRCDYLEGVKVGRRTAIIYTRNDYGDGLEIDPNTAPLMPSLTDLSPRDMQEGSVQMGINIALYFLRSRLDPAGAGAANVDYIAQEVRRNAERVERHQRAAVEAAEISVLEDFDEEFLWALEKDWGDAAEVAPIRAGGKNVQMSIRFVLGDKKKIAVGRDLLEQKDFSKHNALMVDVTSKLSAGCRVSVGVVTMPGWKYFEAPPRYIRPGKNPKVVFRLDQPNFKSEEGQWKYNQRVANLSAVRRVVLLIYPIRGGSIQIDNVRLAKLKLIAEPQPND